MSAAESEANLLRAGHRIGPYTIVRHLGSGAFGAVYEARKLPLDKRIALKLLHRDKALDANIVARFMQEARAAASLRHPHIVDVDDVGVLDGAPFLAMEFLEGESLAARLAREHRLTVATTLSLLLPIFSAVAAVHERGIVHRDLKPDNIHLWKPFAGRVHPKLLDFGIAKVREGHQGASLTQMGAIMGTPMYMSVEQWGGSKHATAQSDQWALGAILFECLTGRLPFEAEEMQALMTRVSLHPPTMLRAFDPTLSPQLEQVVMRAFEKDPARRHASVRAFAHALLPFADAATVGLWQSEFDGAAPALGNAATIAREEKLPPRTQVEPDTLTPRESGAPGGHAAPKPGRRAALLAGAAVVAVTMGGLTIAYRTMAEPSGRAPTHMATPTAVADVPPVRAVVIPNVPDAQATSVDASVALAPPAAQAPAALPSAHPTLPSNAVSGHGRSHREHGAPANAPSNMPIELPAPSAPARPPPPAPPSSQPTMVPIV